VEEALGWQPHVAPASGSSPGGGSGFGRSSDAALDLAYDSANGINPLVWAANRLIDMIPQIRGMTQLADPERLRNQLVTEIKNFEERANSVGVSREELIGARYCLCTVLDEATALTPWGSRGVWAKQSLLVTFHNETEGGEKYNMLLARLLQDPERHKNLIELLYYCNALGFEGRFRIAENGFSQLEILKRRVATSLDKIKGGYEKRLSSHWTGVNSVEPPTWRLVPPWVVAVLCGLLGLMCYFWFLFSLGGRSDITYAKLVALEIPSPVVAKPAPAPQTPPRLRAFLEAEIRAGLLSVRDEFDRSVVTLHGDGLFDTGSTDVRPAYLPVLKRIAGALRDVGGEVVVTGYTDNVPMRSLRFPSNWELSRARAEAVRDLLVHEPGLESRRFRFEGRGEAEPLALNDTPEGRAKNRRVEITVMLSSEAIRRQLNQELEKTSPQGGAQR
jgi:type VI secretion system protein ImpK